MAIHPRQWVDQIGWIGDDEIKCTVDAALKIAFHNLYVLKAIKRSIDPAKPECTLIAGHVVDDPPAVAH
jgi:hypothetical protein